jgi:hypothetical protein
MNREELPAAPLDIVLRAEARRRKADTHRRNAAAQSKLLACALTFAGVVLPLICFAISFPRSPVWQSGSLSDYAQLLLAHKGAAPMYPFLLCCMICMLLVVWWPARWSDRFVFRLGIYFGVIVAFEYWLIFQMALPGSVGSVIAQTTVAGFVALVPWGVWVLLEFLSEHDHPRAALAFGAFVSIASLLAIPYLLFASLWCSTVWAFASYLFVAVRLVRGRAAAPFRFSLAQLFGMVAVLAAHFAAWRISFAWMLEEYAKLPTTQPTPCFVCTAVNRGHASVVQSEVWQAPGGATCRVNDQLRYLKAFELLLASISPRLHRRCRWVYDRIGPCAAALLFHPLLADAGYFLLKPPEWCARACLRVAIPGQMRLVRGLYRAANKLPDNR